MSTPHHFACKLVTARPTFAFDMTDAERAVMGQHAAYWRELLDQGRVVAFGPVLDPAGPWGLAIVEAETADEIRVLEAADPAVMAGIGRFEIYPMPGAIVRA